MLQGLFHGSELSLLAALNYHSPSISAKTLTTGGLLPQSLHRNLAEELSTASEQRWDMAAAQVATTHPEQPSLCSPSAWNCCLWNQTNHLHVRVVRRVLPACWGLSLVNGNSYHPASGMCRFSWETKCCRQMGCFPQTGYGREEHPHNLCDGMHQQPGTNCEPKLPSAGCMGNNPRCRKVKSFSGAGPFPIITDNIHFPPQCNIAGTKCKDEKLLK